MPEPKYTIIATMPTVYQDPVAGIVNGVLVRFRLEEYDEVHELRFPKLDVKLVQQGIDEYAKQRDALSGLGAAKTK